MKPANVTDVHCWRCDAPVFYALLPTVSPRIEIMVDAEPVPTGALWIDDNGFVRDVRTMYLDGEPRYTAHLLTCPVLHPCQHLESEYGRCVDCGMTWEEQRRARGTDRAGRE